MNKQETADTLGITTRTLERHMKAVRITFSMRSGRTGKEAFFDPAEVERFKAELSGAPVSPALVREEATSPDKPRQSLARLEDGVAAQNFVALLTGGVREAMREIVADLSASESLPPAPSVWLTIEQAAEWLGLPRNAVQRALHDDRDGTGQQRRIKALGAGRGLRLHAASIRAYFEG
jgi:hypothetical protein